jgi:hypothetical protein
MQRWLVGEASLEELMGDDMMGPVVASAGMSREEFRLSFAETARRLCARPGENRADERGYVRRGEQTRRFATGF